MALDAESRSSILRKLSSTLGEKDAHALMSQFPLSEAHEPVSKEFMREHLRAELAVLRTEFKGDIASLRTELKDEMHQVTLRLGGALAACTALLASIGLFA